VAGVLVLLAGQPAAAQLKIAYDAKSPPDDLQDKGYIPLRPNVAQPIYFYYYNSAAIAKKNVKITLQQVYIDNKRLENPKVIATATIPTAPAKKFEPIKFELGKLAGQPALKDAAGKEVAAVWPRLDAPPYVLRFLIDDGAIKKTPPITVSVKLQEPREVVNVVHARFEAEKQRLSFKLSTREPFDPPCPVELVLHESAIPGLSRVPEGTFKQKLSKDNREVELSASNIEFKNGLTPRNGRISITVDGFERAFQYTCSFTEGSPVPLKDEMRARIVAPRYSLPSTKLPIVIEIDSKSRTNDGEDILQTSLVDLRFDRSGQKTFEKVVGSPYRGLRELTVEYKAEGEAFLFKTKVNDRVVELDTEGISATKRTLKVQLLNAKQGIIPIANEQDDRDEKVALFSFDPTNVFAPLLFDKNTNTVTAELIIDATPAEDMRLIVTPLRPRQEERLKTRLTVRPRNEEKQAPIAKIVFFVGEAEKDHKPPKDAVKVDAEWSKADNAWVPKEDFIVPADKLGKLVISAEVETATGVAMSRKQELTVIAKNAGQAGGPDVLTTIIGVVKRGARPQPDLPVVLAKAKPNKDDVPKQTKTNGDGKFEFTDVEPGDYVVSAQHLGTFGRQALKINKNQEKASADLDLKTK